MSSPAAGRLPAIAWIYLGLSIIGVVSTWSYNSAFAMPLFLFMHERRLALLNGVPAGA